MKSGLRLIVAAVVAVSCSHPCNSQQSGGDGDAQADTPNGTALQGRMGGGRFQSLSPDQRRAVLQRIMKNRASQNSNGTNNNNNNNNNSPPPVSGNSASANNANMLEKSDIAYGTDPLQRLDVYSPRTSTKPLPILIFVHGGGWKRGDKGHGDRGGKGNAYVSNDIIFVNINYRLAPAVMHPLQVEDIASAFAWVKQHSAEFGGDPNRIFLMGHSAGAQLVDLLGTNERFLAAKGLGLKNISGVISLDTASLNLAERRTDSGPETSLVGPMIDAAFGKDPTTLKDASPTLCIHSGQSYPPFLMFCGSSRLNCVYQHKEFAANLKKAGGQVTITPVPLSHGDINKASGSQDNEIFKDILAMINRR